MLVVGSDPEIFLINKKGELQNALNILPGSKHKPFPTEHGSIQPDNILAEFNSLPSFSLEEFINNHRLILNDLNNFIEPLDLQLDFVASAIGSEELLSDPRTQVSGCEPDFNVWKCKALTSKYKLTANYAPSYLYTNIRAAGGHLHISFDQADDDVNYSNRFKFVKALDYNLGVLSVIHDNDVRRRELYGKAGAFRPKNKAKRDSYNGIEYRTLSNFWLKSEELMKLVYNKVSEVYHNLDEFADKAEFYKDDIKSIINKGLVKESVLFCEKEGIEWQLT